MRVVSVERTCQCTKPECLGKLTHRHHKGCETMWLRTFMHRRRQKQYRSLAKRYARFRPKDTVEICEAHHEEIHEIYNAFIAAECRRKGLRPTSAWTWDEAHAMMKALRKICDDWLTKQTPGLPLKKFAHNRPRLGFTQRKTQP